MAPGTTPRLAGARAAVLGVCVTAAAIAAAKPRQAPDVVPGLPNRYPVVKIFTGPPLVVWLAELTGRRQLLGSPVADQGPRAILDDERSSWLVRSPRADLAVAVRAAAPATDLFLVEARRTGPAPLSRHYLIRRGGPVTQLLCAFAMPASMPIQLRVVTPSPLRLELAGPDGESLAYGQDQEGLCQPSLPATPPSDFIYENAFAHAEMMYRQERSAEAGDLSERVLHMRPDGVHAEEAARHAFFARSNYLDMQCFPAPDDLEPIAIEGPLAKRIRSSEDYVRLFPQAELAAQLTLQKASDLEGCNHLEESAALFESLIGRRSNPAVERRARLLLDGVRTKIARRDAKRGRR
jgi:hypothetical protein